MNTNFYLYTHILYSYTHNHTLSSNQSPSQRSNCWRWLTIIDNTTFTAPLQTPYILQLLIQRVWLKNHFKKSSAIIFKVRFWYEICLAIRFLKFIPTHQVLFVGFYENVWQGGAQHCLQSSVYAYSNSIKYHNSFIIHVLKICNVITKC